GRSGSRVGGSHEPSMTAAATVAMCSGLAVTWPCPMVAAAFSVAPVGVGKEPPLVLRPTVYLALKPNSWAAVVRSAGARAAVDRMKAVLHDLANASPNGTVPRTKLSALWKTRPPALVSCGQLTGVSGVVPWASRALPDTILNVEPGG